MKNSPESLLMRSRSKKLRFGYLNFFSNYLNFFSRKIPLLDRAASFDLGDLRRGSVDFFQNIFEIKVFQKKRWSMSQLWKFSINLSLLEVCSVVLNQRLPQHESICPRVVENQLELKFTTLVQNQISSHSLHIWHKRT